MSEAPHIRVYRFTDAPLKYCDLAYLGQDSDLIVVVSKADPHSLSVDAHWLASLITHDLRVGDPSVNHVSARHENETEIIYTVNRGS